MATIPSHAFKSAFAKQTAEGTAATTAEYQVPVFGGAVMPDENRANYAVVDGADYFPGQFKTRADCGGSPVYAGFPDSIGRLFASHLGNDTKTGAADPWTHTMIKGALPDWMTWWTWRPKSDGSFEVDRHTDCIIKSLEVQWQNGELVKVAPEVIGKTTSSNVGAPTVTTTNVLDSVGPWYTWAGAVILFDPATTPAATTVHNFQSFTIHMGYDDATLEQTDDLVPSILNRGRWTLGFSASLIQSDWDLYNLTHFGTAAPSSTAPSAIVKVGSLDITVKVGPTQDTNRRIIFTLPSMELSLGVAGPDPSGGVLKPTITGVVEKPAAGAPLTVALRNAVSVQY